MPSLRLPHYFFEIIIFSAKFWWNTEETQLKPCCPAELSLFHWGFSSCWRRDQMQKYSGQTCSCLSDFPVVISRRKHLLCFPPSLSTLQIPPYISTIHWSFHFAVGGWRAWEGSPFVVHLNCSAKPRPYQHAAASVNGNYMCLWKYRKSAPVGHQHCSLSYLRETVGVLMAVEWTSFCACIEFITSLWSWLGILIGRKGWTSAERCMLDVVTGLRKQCNSSYWVMLICLTVNKLPDLKFAGLIINTRVGAICVCRGNITFPSDSEVKKSPKLLHKRQYHSQGCAVALNVSTTTRPQGWCYLISVRKTMSNGNGKIKARAIRAGM